MSDSAETPHESKPHLHQEYEDPYYHDEDDLLPVEEGERPTVRPALGVRKPNRPVPPPPRRRFYED